MMRKALLVVISGIAIASMGSTVEAKRNCHREVKKSCAPEICCTPAQEIHGVLCRRVDTHKYVPQDDRCCTRKVPCIGTRKMKLPNTVKFRVVEECVEGAEIDVPCIEESCCEEKVPCAPKCVPCVEYIPVDLDIKQPCTEPFPSCETNSSCSRSSSSSNMMEEEELAK